ncbi:MAG: photosynthesis system II assembly factor Ycf48 [Prochloraceae cyanobacterium]
MNLFVRKLKQILILLAVCLFCISCSKVPSTSDNPWKVMTLPTESTFADIDFIDDSSHGWLVGSISTLFETTDGGESWEEKTLDLGEEKASFTAVSFSGQEGWITGKPSILLHTNDGGKTWSRIPLSEKLPGAPYSILALGTNSAEMVTDLGAIYKTEDGGRTWKASVEAAVGVARNINRSADGKYVAVSARGNFYSTWEPGQTEWKPHQRNSSRRIQNMGFTQDGRLWLLARGGQVQFSNSEDVSEDVEDWGDVLYPEPSTSWGLLDISYRTPEEMWLVGGSGNLLRSLDNGKTWEKDRDVEDVPSNFYKVLFVTPEKGFVLGQKGVLLKYEPPTEAA